ncbi:MAG: hypothetical protein JW915_14745 [Chitinispirillaceae bacterium]|nr:hypothetical protein [Chitinispirillaceae bacterium]
MLVVDPAFNPFCYPDRGISVKSVRIVEETGYHYTVTTNGSWIDQKRNHFTLNRTGMHQDMTSGGPLTFARITG